MCYVRVYMCRVWSGDVSAPSPTPSRAEGGAFGDVAPPPSSQPCERSRVWYARFNNGLISQGGGGRGGHVATWAGMESSQAPCGASELKSLGPAKSYSPTHLACTRGPTHGPRSQVHHKSPLQRTCQHTPVPRHQQQTDRARGRACAMGRSKNRPREAPAAARPDLPEESAMAAPAPKFGQALASNGMRDAPMRLRLHACRVHLTRVSLRHVARR